MVVNASIVEMVKALNIFSINNVFNIPPQEQEISIQYI